MSKDVDGPYSLRNLEKNSGISRMSHFTALLNMLLVATHLFRASAQVPDIMVNTGTQGNISDLESRWFRNLGSKRVRITYGPFIVPSSYGEQHNSHEASTITQLNSTMPCKNCTITWMQAGLQYPNGSYANANTSMWLHHLAIFNGAIRDSVCEIPTTGERLFASGNERSAIDLSNNGTSYTGYFLDKNATFFMQTSLMNLLPYTREVVTFVDYEYVPGLPSNFGQIRPVWLDVGTCISSDVSVAEANITEAKTYQSSRGWTSTFSGRIVSVYGHVHDGATGIEFLRRNTRSGKDEVACNSVATYNGSPGFVEPTRYADGNFSNLTHSPTDHISSISSCRDIGRMELGERWWINAHYDFPEHAPMRSGNGSLSPIMGIGLVYVAVDEKINGTSETTGTSPTAATPSEPLVASGMTGIAEEGGTAAAPSRQLISNFVALTMLLGAMMLGF